MSSSNIEVNKLNTLTGHKDCVYALCGAMSQDGFFSSGADGQVIAWNLQDLSAARLLAKIPSSVYAMSVIAERNCLIIGQNFEGIHLVDIKTKSQLGSLKLNKAAIFDIKVFKNLLLVACGDGTLYAIDHEKLIILKEIKCSDKSARTIEINPVERQFAVGYSDHKIRIFSLEDYQFVQEVAGHSNSVFTMRYSPDYRWLLSAGRDALLKVWDVEAGYTEKESIAAHMYTINHIDYNPSGENFVTCSMDKSIKVWDATTFKLLKVIDKARHAGHGTSVNKLFWTSFNNWLISCSDDRTVSVWDLNIGDSI